MASSWTWANVAYSETCEALVDGLQRALWKLKGVPWQLCLDNMTAATHDLRKGKGRTLTKRFADVCEHLGFETLRRINVRKAHENGAVEVRHGRTKKLLRQAMILRGSTDFSSLEEYESFVEETLDRAHNRHIEARLEEERPHLRPLLQRPVPIYTREEPRGRCWSAAPPPREPRALQLRDGVSRPSTRPACPPR